MQMCKSTVPNWSDMPALQQVCDVGRNKIKQAEDMPQLNSFQIHSPVSAVTPNPFSNSVCTSASQKLAICLACLLITASLCRQQGLACRAVGSGCLKFWQGLVYPILSGFVSDFDITLPLCRFPQSFHSRLELGILVSHSPRETLADAQPLHRVSWL